MKPELYGRIMAVITLPIWYLPFCLLVGTEILWDTMVKNGGGYTCPDCERRRAIDKMVGEYNDN